MYIDILSGKMLPFNELASTRNLFCSNQCEYSKSPLGEKYLNDYKASLKKKISFKLNRYVLQN